MDSFGFGSGRTVVGPAVLLAATLAIGVSSGSAMAGVIDVYVRTSQSGAQTFLNRNAISHWTFSTNANAVSQFVGGFFQLKGSGAVTAPVQFMVIAGTYADFLSRYDASNGVYTDTGSLSVLSASAAASTIGSGAFGNYAIATAAITLAANTTFTAVLWSAASGSGSDTYLAKANGELFFADSSGTPYSPPGYSTNQDLTIQSLAVPGAGLASLAVVGLAARRRRR